MGNPMLEPRLKSEIGFGLESKLGTGQKIKLSEDAKRRIIPYKIPWESIPEDEMRDFLRRQGNSVSSDNAGNFLKLMITEHFFYDLERLTGFRVSYYDKDSISGNPNFFSQYDGRTISGVGEIGKRGPSISRMVKMEKEYQCFFAACRIYSRNTFNFVEQYIAASRLAGTRRNLMFMGIITEDQFRTMSNPDLIKSRDENEPTNKTRSYVDLFLNKNNMYFLLVFSDTNRQIHEKAKGLIN